MCADIRRLIDERQSVRHPTDADRKPLSDLLQRVPHHSIKSGRVPDETMDTLKPLSDTAHPLAFLSYAELSDHLAAMDAILESDALADTSMLNAVSTPSHESLSNPNNGYNWLCINEPKVFLPDGETERPAKAAIPREKGKRASMAATKPGEIPEVAAMAGVTVVEEDPSGPGNNPNSTKKRKRIEEGEDGNYHPKTGRLDDPKPRKRAYSRKKKADDGSTGDGTGTAGEGDTPKPKRIRARAKPKAKPAPVSDGVGPMVLGQDVPEQEYSLGQGQEPEPAPQQDVAHKPEQQLESGSHALNDSAMPGTPGATSQAGV